MSETDGAQDTQSTAPAAFADDGGTGVHSLDQDLVLGLQGLTDALARKHRMLRLACGVSAGGALTTGLLLLGTIAATTGWELRADRGAFRRVRDSLIVHMTVDPDFTPPCSPPFAR
jgi:hypothetical protein